MAKAYEAATTELKAATEKLLAAEAGTKDANAQLLLKSWYEKGCTEPDFIGDDGKPNVLGMLAWTNPELFETVASKLARGRATIPSKPVGQCDESGTVDTGAAILARAIEAANKAEDKTKRAEIFFETAMAAQGVK